MCKLTIVGVLGLLALPACGSSDGSGAKETKAPTDTSVSGSVFNPGPVEEGYQRFAAQTVKDLEPGGDVTYCQYVMAGSDHDVDIMDVTGLQSAWGHHAIAFAYNDDGTQELDKSVPCMGSEFNSGEGLDPSAASTESLNVGSFLGGIAGKGGRSVPLPEGVAFRLKKGQGIMMNVHYINTGTKTVDADSVIDVKFAEPDPKRIIAAMFVNVDLDINVQPDARGDSTVECKAGSDVQLLMMTNHMHEFGTSATTEIFRGGSGSPEMVHEDPTWTYEMQFNADYSRWTPEAPFLIHAGDTLRTTCHWANTRTDTLTFPREMCVGVGFALATGENPHAPGCIAGSWMPQYF